ncbi:DUF1835 domain-containing protein [Aliikangiella marina]|uniref:DUF1835 domain-containing protein n=1 Tax=Aliikangiella marina TaxID=1712262 RepID=A0A545T168_9GAMM|nr:DUF1835 domain-containing protein [Aliikangiella marina]TQV70965.1 DUF1835 domain-containing protein [Aliikangiella marina]
MTNRLHITNGSSTVSLLRAAGIDDPAFSWDDILHEGPVPNGLGLSRLSEVRAKYIASLGFDGNQEILAQFVERDLQLQRSLDYQEIILWFEHDLYDQLQLIQLLDWFNRHALKTSEIYLINPNRHLGYHSPEEVPGLFSTRKIVSNNQYKTAQQAWLAFTADTPERFNQLLNSDLSVLPYLSDALLRMAREYPSVDSGLPLTEKMILDCLSRDPVHPGQLFRKYSEKERDQFLGDMTFFAKIEQMAEGSKPLLIIDPSQKIEPPIASEVRIIATDYAQLVLKSKGNWFDDNQMCKWIGGCQVTPQNRLRWDSARQQIIYHK